MLALHSASQALEQPRVSNNISSPLFTAERLLPDQVQDANHWVAPKCNRWAHSKPVSNLDVPLASAVPSGISFCLLRLTLLSCKMAIMMVSVS